LFFNKKEIEDAWSLWKTNEEKEKSKKDEEEVVAKKRKKSTKGISLHARWSLNERLCS